MQIKLLQLLSSISDFQILSFVIPQEFLTAVYPDRVFFITALHSLPPGKRRVV